MEAEGRRQGRVETAAPSSTPVNNAGSPNPRPTAAETASPGPTPEPTPDGLPLDSIIGFVGIVLAVMTIFLGLRKPDISTASKTLISVLELLVLIASVVAFGWGGLVVFVISLVLAVLISSVRLALQHESILVSAAIESGRDKAEMQALYKRLRRSNEALEWLGPIQTATLIRLLSQRARSSDEIESMAVPIAMLLAAFDPLPMEDLVRKFDRLLRAAGKPATSAMEIADTLTRSTQQSAATLMEMVDALLAFYEG